ncbi:MAG: helix-turn-helix domain-containing protein [Chloroflexi bacterium]|nr:helix-turn-helix domain-containing protein [Chloroflexota bacterium]
MVALDRDAVLAPDEETPAIRELDTLLADPDQPETVVVGPAGKRVRLPESVRKLLARAVHELARGNAVSIVPTQAELTTQQAAELLNVSRPFLIKLLEAGEIPCHYVGSHRRVRFGDLMAYRQRRSQSRRQALMEMAREAQEMGLYG